MRLPKIVSLFSGAGGLDHGFSEAGFPISLAVDQSVPAIETHKANFPQTTSIAADLTRLGSDGIIAALTPLLALGERIGVIGGPPCQGFSRANTTAVATDPRNALPLLYLEIVEALQADYDVRFVLFENVLGIRDLKHEKAFSAIRTKLGELGFAERVTEYCALDYGVPQTRRRVVISAFRSQAVLKAFVPVPVTSKELDVRSAIGGLPEPQYYSRGLRPDDIPFHPNHWTMRPVSKRFVEPVTATKSTRSFKRLAWDRPSPTVAYGHREIHVHPDGHRRLSIYEAMMLQGFPATFVLSGSLSAQVDQVSNAVPPPLALALALATRTALAQARNPCLRRSS